MASAIEIVAFIIAPLAPRRACRRTYASRRFSVACERRRDHAGRRCLDLKNWVRRFHSHHALYAIQSAEAHHDRHRSRGPLAARLHAQTHARSL